jgi:methionine-rich copper-binding protein CopC
MKKLLVMALGLLVATAVTLNAQEATKTETTKKKDQTPEQKQHMKEMVKKYDLNSDKKLDKDELAKVSADDKKKMQEEKIWPAERKNKNKKKAAQ